jgi:two-component system sensor histidine kinase UhpB
MSKRLLFSVRSPTNSNKSRLIFLFIKKHFSTRIKGTQPRYPFSVLSDLMIVVSLVLGFFMCAVYLELSEKISGITKNYEHWQLDELPQTLLLLSIGLSWFAFRRTRDARRELNERIRAQNNITELLSHNRDLSQRLILVQESERRALARELHDEFGQNCTAIRAEASYIVHAKVTDNVRVSAELIAQAAEALSNMIRDILRRLRPANLDSLGIEPALQELCEVWEKQTGIACGLITRDIPSQLSDSTSIAIFRLVQESLTNVKRHAEATQVRILLYQDSAYRKLVLSIQDDGCGMLNPDGSHCGFGLIGMRERVAALDGGIHFFSETGSGLRITVELPVNSEAL